jgi:hypothetical protein
MAIDAPERKYVKEYLRQIRHLAEFLFFLKSYDLSPKALAQALDQNSSPEKIQTRYANSNLGYWMIRTSMRTDSFNMPPALL